MIPGPKPEPVIVPPTITGTHGRAWKCDHAAFVAKHGVKPGEVDATVVNWLIEAPWAHPFWHSYTLTLVHLRPMPDARPTIFYLDGASHELWLYALDPGKPREPAIRGEAFPSWLTPSNFAAQIVAPSDEAAAARIEGAVRRICDGTLSPDTDFIRQWMHLFGDNMIKGDKKGAGETRLITPAGVLVIPPQPGPQDLN